MTFSKKRAQREDSRRDGAFMNWPLYRSMHGRCLTQVKLAALTGIHRSVLARILTNEPGRGKESRVKIFPHLLAGEIVMLGWQQEYAIWLQDTGQPVDKKDALELAIEIQKKLAELKTDTESIYLEQSATGNIVPSAPNVKTP